VTVAGLRPTSPVESTPLGVRWDGVTVVLGGRRVVDGVDLEVAAGTWLSLVGPNGAGKTSLVRTLAGTVRHQGTVSIGARDAAALPARQRGRCVAVVPQHPVVPTGMTAFDYVLLGRAPHQGLRFAASLEDRQRAYAVLQRLELGPLFDRRVDSLSGGERQRVVLARSLAQDTPVLVLDEPTSFLDIGHQLEVLELIAELRAERALTVITTLHDLSVAGQFADVVAVMATGRVVAVGTAAQVLTPELIACHWGVKASVAVDDHGGVTVTTLRRRGSGIDGRLHRRHCR